MIQRRFFHLVTRFSCGFVLCTQFSRDAILMQNLVSVWTRSQSLQMYNFLRKGLAGQY